MPSLRYAVWAVCLVACGGPSLEPMELGLRVEGEPSEVRASWVVPKGWVFVDGIFGIADGRRGAVEMRDPEAWGDATLTMRVWVCGPTWRKCDDGFPRDRYFDDNRPEVRTMSPAHRVLTWSHAVEHQYIVAHPDRQIGVRCTASVSEKPVYDYLANACANLELHGLESLLGDAQVNEQTKRLDACPKQTTMQATSRDPARAKAVFGADTKASANGDLEVVIASKEGNSAVSIGLVPVPHAVVTNAKLPIAARRDDGHEGQAAAYAVVAVTTTNIPKPDEPPDDTVAVVEESNVDPSGPSLGSVDIIARTRDRVCGTIDVEVSGWMIKGAFDAPITR